MESVGLACVGVSIRHARRGGIRNSKSDRFLGAIILFVIKALYNETGEFLVRILDKFSRDGESIQARIIGYDLKTVLKIAKLTFADSPDCHVTFEGNSNEGVARTTIELQGQTMLSLKSLGKSGDILVKNFALCFLLIL